MKRHDDTRLRCDQIEELVDAQERGKAVEVEHVCADPLRHAGPLDDLIDSLVDYEPGDDDIQRWTWEEAVANGEPWATRDIPEGRRDA